MAASSLDAATAAVFLTSDLANDENFDNISNNNNNNNNNNDTSFVFDIYDDGRAGSNTGAASVPFNAAAPPLLPGGPCNFVDLAHGYSGAQCGCRRFWSRASAASTPRVATSSAFDVNGTGNAAAFDADQANWCMCSHHACFHDQVAPPATSPTTAFPAERPLSSFFSTTPTGGAAAATVTTAAASGLTAGSQTNFAYARASAPTASATPRGQENERPRPSRAPLSPVDDPMAYHMLTDKDTGQENQNSNDRMDMPFNAPAAGGRYFASDASFAATMAGTAHTDGRARAATLPTTGHAALSVGPSSVATSVAEPAPDDSIPDTMSWGPVGQSAKDGHTTLPLSAVPSQGSTGLLLPPSQQHRPPSTATSSTSQMRYIRPFAGKGLQTLARTTTCFFPRKTLPSTSERGDDGGAPLAADEAVQHPSEAHAKASFATGSSISSASSRREALESLSSVVQAHDLRLEKLENPSFSFFPGHEECQDKHDHADLRVTELESRVDEVERRLNNNDEASTVAGGSIVFSRRRLLGRDDDATTASVVSMATDATTSIASRVSVAAEAAATAARTLSSAEREEIFGQLQALHAQVSLLQATSLPSHNKPWQLEVVFLPFPLKGIWVEAGQFPTTDVAAAAAAQRRQSGGGQRMGAGQGEEHHNTGWEDGNHHNDDEWTQTPETTSRRTPDPGLPGAWSGSADWATDYPAAPPPLDAPRLLPRAPVPGRVIDSRLRNGGLVKTLSVRGADARSLQTAMYAAFGHVFQAMATSSSSTRSSSSHTAFCHSYGSTKPRSSSSLRHTASAPSMDNLQAQFLGLQQPWVPLRKVHKDSRLRFLTRAEMLTPAVWDAAFLMSGVVMKASGLHRLYVTQPDAYLQDRHAYKCGWSWQRIRELNRVSDVASGGRGDGNCAVPTTGSKAPAVDAGAAKSCWTWDSRLDEPPPSSPSPSLSPSLSNRHRPSPSPFSRGVTPTNDHANRAHLPHPANFGHRAHSMATTAAAVNPVRSHSLSGSGSGSTQQFWTAGQSPLHPPVPLASSTLRRSPSPFFTPAQPAKTRPLSSSKAARPSPIRTVSMPAPPAHGYRPTSTRMAMTSPTGTATTGKRRVQSAGYRTLSSSSSSHQHPGEQRRSSVTSYERQVSPFFSTNRPSPRTATFPAPTMHSTNSNVAVGASAGVSKRRHSTRSPSIFWTRNTPRRSMSRSPSLAPGPMAAWARDDQVAAVLAATTKPAGDGEQRIRGTTPFCYATPYSNMDPPPSSLRRHRHGSRDPIGTAGQNKYDRGHGFDGYLDDHDMLGFDSEDLDYPMTQDGDGSDEGDDDNDSENHGIKVYEDDVDVTDANDSTERTTTSAQQQPQSHYPQLRLPEDEPWPGIEDNDDERSHEQDHDEDMSDSENMDPLSLASFEADMVEVDGNGCNDDDDDIDDSGRESHDHVEHGESGDEHGGETTSSQGSDASSQPSEYPSTHRAWQMSQAGGAGAGAVGVSRSVSRGVSRAGSRAREIPQPVAAAGLLHAGHGHIDDNNNELDDDDLAINFRIHEDDDANLEGWVQG
ncbi:hypothetical protein SPI_08655 [Niveomyces insectorum RCEF 264]|uniref:Uncharacterized protein n=1 Tax=Niveomyces insectorum RCEF 264 TaxID=1081102 RepID=A0A167MUY4_9HYPO|nr:hypothetical protein SPI_08655 [Niveomyces insectorum RCEF 264]